MSVGGLGRCRPAAAWPVCKLLRSIAVVSQPEAIMYCCVIYAGRELHLKKS